MTEPYPGQPPLTAKLPPVSPPPPPPGTTSSGVEGLRQLDWRQFEQVIGSAFQMQGYQVLPTADRADGGVDLILVRGQERIFVQCKHWKAWQVPVAVVRELFGVVVANRASGGIVVTSGSFSREAIAFAQQSGTTLLDGPAVQRLLAAGKIQTPPSLVQQPSPNQAMPSTSLGTPSCPICLAPMLLRKARRGQRAGSSFWGCSRYPGCKGILEAPGMVRAPQRGHANVAPVQAGRPARRRSRTRFMLALVYLLALPLVLGLIWTVFTSVLLKPFVPSPALPSVRLVPSVAAPSKEDQASAAPSLLGEQPMDIAIDTKAKRLYTANFVSGNVSVLDENTLQVVDTIDVPGKPVAIAVDPKNHRIFVADGVANRVFAVDTRSGKTTATMKTPAKAADLSYDPLRGRLFVGSAESTYFWVFSTITGRLLRSVPTYGPATSLAIDTQAGRLYAAYSSNVFSYRLSDLVRDNMPHVGMFADGIAIDSKRQRLYVITNGHTVREHNLLTGTSKLLDLDGDATAVCIDPSTRTAYLADPDGNVIRQLHLK